MAVQTNCPYTIVHIGTEDELLAMRILPSEDRTTFKPGPRLAVAIAAAKGNLVIKNVEEKIGISLSFPKGGVTRD